MSKDGRFLQRQHRSLKIKGLQLKEAAASPAQLYFVSVSMCTVNTLLPSGMSYPCVYTLETFMSVYMDVLSVACVCRRMLSFNLLRTAFKNSITEDMCCYFHLSARLLKDPPLVPSVKLAGREVGV